jgi:hypothetical protein
MKQLTKLIILLTLLVGCREFHFDDFQEGADGGTSYPFITEIPPTPDHLNGGWMHTWYILDASLQLTPSSNFIGAYPIYNGNDGADGTNGQDGITPHIGVDGYWWIGDYRTLVNSVGADGQDGADGKSPIIIENYWYVWDIATETYINTYITSGTDGTDGVGVDHITEEPSPNCGELSGVKVTIHLTDGSSYYFSVCNGADGELAPPPPYTISNFCTGAYSTNDRAVIDEGFNSETVPYASGWTSMGDFYDFIDDHLVVKGRKSPIEVSLTTPDLQLASLTEIRVEAFEYQKDHHKFIRAWVLDTEGNWTLLDKKEVTIYYKKDRDPQLLIWNTSVENITNVKFTFESDSGDKDDPISHDESKIVIDKITINGVEVTCV